LSFFFSDRGRKGVEAVSRGRGEKEQCHFFSGKKKKRKRNAFSRSPTSRADALGPQGQQALQSCAVRVDCGSAARDRGLGAAVPLGDAPDVNNDINDVGG
jgi:hypothetical protein